MDLFRDYEWKSIEDYKHYKKVVEDNHIYKFLVGLKSELDEVRGRIIGRKPPLLPIGEIFSAVRREETRRNVMLGRRTITGPMADSLEQSTSFVSEVNTSRSNFTQ